MLSPQRWLGDQFSEGRFTVRDLIDLAAADEDEVQKDHLHTVFEWYHQRSVAAVRGFLASAFALVAAGLAAVLKDGTDVDEVYIGLGGTAVLGLAVAAYLTNRELGHLHREYLASVRLLSELRELRQALREYPYLKAGDGN